MAYVNFQRSYVRFKIVDYGPGLCGKTANLEHLHEVSKGEELDARLNPTGRAVFPAPGLREQSEAPPPAGRQR